MVTATLLVLIVVLRFIIPGAVRPAIRNPGTLNSPGNRDAARGRGDQARELTTSGLVREIVATHYEKSAARRAGSGESMSTARNGVTVEKRLNPSSSRSARRVQPCCGSAFRPFPRRRWSKYVPRLPTTPGIKQRSRLSASIGSHWSHVATHARLQA
jgi:hypothetical protein